MANPQPRPVERLVFFTDAVVAIAMTLLILPLLESVSEAARDGLTTSEYLAEHDGQLIAFTLSFVIIATFWRSHDRLFGQAAFQDAGLAWLNIAWMLTIVWLPVVTAMVGAMQTDSLQLALYIGSMLASSLCIFFLQWRLYHHPELLRPQDAEAPRLPRPFPVTSGFFVLALLIAIAVPRAGFWSLLVLLADPVLEAVLRRRAHRKDTDGDARAVPDGA